MKKYNKRISVHYKFVESLESGNALAQVFDDIFKRLIKKQEKRIYRNFDSLTAVVFGVVLEHRGNYRLTFN